MRLLEEDGQEIRVVGADEIAAREQALAASKHLIAGGILCPTDETGNSSLFTKALAKIVVERGGRILTGTHIQRIHRKGDLIDHIATDRGEFKADAYVLCLGSESPILARKIKLSLPIYPVKGYSLSIPVIDPDLVPKVPVLDEHNLVAFTPMGKILRVTATAEFAGYDRTHKPSDFAFMLQLTKELFPKGLDFGNVHMWAGLRPMTPDNLPVLGQRGIRNLWLNTGHGHIGWTMSHGSARILADLVAGRAPPIPLDGIFPRQQSASPDFPIIRH
jgi:D-amino-acid dehydrogenase